MALDLMTGNIPFNIRDCDLKDHHPKAITYDDVRTVLKERGAVDIFFEDSCKVFSLWIVKDGPGTKPPTHIAILSAEPHNGPDNWFIVEEQQFYLCDEEKAVVTFVSRLHQDDWEQYDKTDSLFPDTTINGKTEEQFVAEKKAVGSWPFARVEA